MRCENLLAARVVARARVEREALDLGPREVAQVAQIFGKAEHPRSVRT